MLQQWLRDRCVPVVATLVTEDADLACRKNNLNFEQLVRCGVTNLCHEQCYNPIRTDFDFILILECKKQTEYQRGVNERTLIGISSDLPFVDVV